MTESYSLYEAKAKLSALVRQVREGRTVIITVHGKPAAELRPIEPAGQTLEERLDWLEARGSLIRAKAAPDPSAFKPIARRPGALKRFLDERD
ncbi:MAG: type II toxin-antitoxin system prevent-host-death family antitoxin [Gemmatimonadales bacterium]